MKGILELPVEIVSKKENVVNTNNAINNWNFRADNVALNNKPYWQKMAKIWGVDEEQARNQICGNCSHFDNSPEMLKAMKDEYPLNDFDINESYQQRGYCTKLEFACHVPRACQAWESRESEYESD